MGPSHRSCRESVHPGWWGSPSGATGRGQSNIIGVVLIIGMVVASATLITLAGASIMDQFRERTGQESTTNAIEEIDSELSSVASVGGLTRTEFNLGDARPSQYRIVQEGHINVTANRNASCRASIPLSSLRYTRDDGVVLGYEAGGVWRHEPGILSQTVVHTPPDFTLQNGTLSLSVMNISGEISGSENLVYEDVGSSISTNRELRDAIFTGTCARPDNVTVSVTSDFYLGWSRYMKSSLNATDHDAWGGNETARVYIDQDRLPEEVNDSRNNVVDLNKTTGTFNDIKVTDSSIRVDKGANNTYTTIVTPLSSGSTQVGEIRTVETDAAFRAPLDVVFTVDESGSMDGAKAQNAKQAARTFVGKMNSTFDRAGVVGYNDSWAGEPPSYYHVTDEGQYITNDFGSPGPTATDGVNGSINELADERGTNMGAGLHDANVLLGVKSNSSREKVIILLADGENSEDEYRAAAYEEAEIADKEGITIHTIGVGDLGASGNQTMEGIAETTGGTYRYVADADDLTDVFEDLFDEISTSRQVVRNPFSMQISAGGSTFQPQIDGETGHVANGTGGELNLNDPTAPTGFSYSIDISDGENVSMTALDYDCLEWEQTDNVYTNGTGKQYGEVRCVDIDESSRTPVPASDMTVYVDGENVSALLSEPSNWWDTPINETLEDRGYLGGPDNTTLELESNQALVVFEFEDDDGATDRLVALYRIGQSRQEAVPKHIFNLEVRHLVIAGDE